MCVSLSVCSEKRDRTLAPRSLALSTGDRNYRASEQATARIRHRRQSTPDNQQSPSLHTPQVIPLAHAHVWPTDGANSLNASHSGSSSYVLRQAVPGNGGRGGGTSPSWARAVLGMGHSVTESIGRAAGLAIRSGGGSSAGSSSGGGVGGGGAGHRRGARGGGGQGGRNGGGGPGTDGFGLDDACSGVAAVAGRGASVAGSAEPGSSLSSWRGMKSGATWAFGGGEFCGCSPSSSIDSRSWKCGCERAPGYEAARSTVFCEPTTSTHAKQFFVVPKSWRPILFACSCVSYPPPPPHLCWCCLQAGVSTAGAAAGKTGVASTPLPRRPWGWDWRPTQTWKRSRRRPQLAEGLRERAAAEVRPWGRQHPPLTIRKDLR